MKVRIATRSSRLALIQATLAARALARHYPDHQFLLETVETHGDRTPGPLTEASQEGVFVKDLERALLEGRAELAVHSAKDLPTLATPGLVVAAFLPRGDARDVLIAREPATLRTLPPGARIGTGSPRRSAQLTAMRPDLVPTPIRGNVDTRLRRLAEGVVDALVLAAAGVERLGRLGEVHEFLEVEVMLPAPGQGALAVQGIAGSGAARLAEVVDDPATARAVLAERAVLRGLGGGCLSAVGVHAVADGEEIVVRAVVLAENGTRLLRASARGAKDAEVVARVVDELRRTGAGRLLRPADARGPLAGLRVMVTRADGQAAGMRAALEGLGAQVVACPVIAIRPLPVAPAQLQRLDRYDWVVFTSANGVDRWFELLEEAAGVLPASCRVAAIGPETAARLAQRKVRVDLVPERFIAEGLAEALAEALVRGTRILMPRAAGGRDLLPEELRRRGAQVDVIETYEAVPPAELAERLPGSLAGVDVVTLTSSSTARHFAAALAAPLSPGVRIACIGPVTAASARAAGLPVDIIAEEYTTRGLVEAIVRSRAPVPG